MNISPDTIVAAAPVQAEALSSEAFDEKMGLLASPDVSKFLFRPAPNLFGKSPFYEKNIKAKFQNELNMENTSYNPALPNETASAFITNAKDLGSALRYIFNPSYPSDDRQFIIETLEYPQEDGSRLAYLREKGIIPEGYFSFHKIGNGYSDPAGVSWHDMGGFVAPDGNVIVFVALNQHQTESLDPVNNFESKAFSLSLEVLGK